MRADSWSDERIEVLKRLWAEGKAASAIAKKLGGISRSAVLGKIFRLRLGAGDSGEPPAAKAKQKTNTRARKSQRGVRKIGPARRRGDVETKTAAKPARVSTYKSLLELTNGCCRWPHGRPGAKNFFFCGATGADVENGMPYCAPHMRRAYVVAPANAITPWRVVSQAGQVSA
jgi:GcrA cell cycle regulator